VATAKKENKLVIVESPTKAKTIGAFLGRGFTVKSSFGHVRDLPKGKMGVDTEADFKASYVIPTKARKTVSELKKLAAKSDEIYFATDEDREGEAISWHLAEVLGEDPSKLKRITFHEITEEAILHAVENPRKLDLRLVDAQQARRILDRLVGYELSPLLWKKVLRGLSAGRVQSVAVRLVVTREREILAFKPQEYWSLEALFKKNDAAVFPGKLIGKNDQAFEKFSIPDKTAADAILAALSKANAVVGAVEKKKAHRSPNAPFTTSTLQQEANRRLNFSAKQTMMLAQHLYERGFITYMRTDSVNLAEKFLTESRAWITKELGINYAAADGSRKFKGRQKNAQEAHEAIRPTVAAAPPESLATDLDADHLRLYDLIWRRAIASQMSEAVLDQTSVSLKAAGSDGTYDFRANGMTVGFDGYYKIYPTDTKETILPELQPGETVNFEKLESVQHFTEPPARYSDASLVKALEEYGIGRPSTYAPTIATIIDRNYVERIENRRLKPTEIAMTVNDLLVEHFPDIVDYNFTAKMEEGFDEIAEGKKEMVPFLREFWNPFKSNLDKKMVEIVKQNADKPTDQVCEKCGKPMVEKTGRFGKFLSCSGFPECKNAKPLPGSAEDMKTDEKCPTCGAPMMVKRGRFGPFISCTRYPDCKTIKKIEKKTGVACPECGQGELVERRSIKTRRNFYSCNKYPDCKFAVWSKPTGEKCPKCQSLLILGKDETVVCSNKECDFKKDAPPQPLETV
jgi:DNA topoisomerase-1